MSAQTKPAPLAVEIARVLILGVIELQKDERTADSEQPARDALTAADTQPQEAEH